MHDVVTPRRYTSPDFRGTTGMGETRLPLGEHDRFRLAMTASGIGMAIVDLEGRWLEVNPALERMLGYPAQELLGRTAIEFTHPDDIEASRGYLAGLVDGFIPVLDVRKRYVHRDGRDVWVQANVATMRDDAGTPLYLVVQLRDISAELAAERALQAHDRERNEALDRSNRQLQLFTDAVSHDLRAPLRAIESFSRRLAERAGDRLTDEETEHLQRIREAAKRMTGLLDALNELSHATRAELRTGDVDLSLLAEWVNAELQDAEPTREAVVRIQPGLTCWGDERLLKLLLTQLLDNAWKFSDPARPVRIEIGGGADHGRLTVDVRDHGTGFDMRYAHKLFEPFQRLHGPDQGGGHGLGLAVAQRIAQRHGGSIRAHSQAGEGSTFTLDLPAHAPAADEAHA
ncbi:MAG: PAS domain S-box protein [Pseudomonas sp.]|nr:PAS domain S-box protein [Pseudomonas sp.]